MSNEINKTVKLILTELDTIEEKYINCLSEMPTEPILQVKYAIDKYPKDTDNRPDLSNISELLKSCKSITLNVSDKSNVAKEEEKLPITNESIINMLNEIETKYIKCLKKIADPLNNAINVMKELIDICNKSNDNDEKKNMDIYNNILKELILLKSTGVNYPFINRAIAEADAKLKSDITYIDRKINEWIQIDNKNINGILKKNIERCKREGFELFKGFHTLSKSKDPKITLTYTPPTFETIMTQIQAVIKDISSSVNEQIETNYTTQLMILSKYYYLKYLEKAYYNKINIFANEFEYIDKIKDSAIFHKKYLKYKQKYIFLKKHNKT
jgi:hypothetical protein